LILSIFIIHQNKGIYQEDLIMKRLSLSILLALIPVVTLLAACGGGGGGGDAGVTVQQPTTAIIKLATTINGTIPANTIITGYDVLISLPAGVTVKSTTTPPQTNDGVVTATGAAAGASVAAVYSAATSTLSGTIRILIAEADGFSAGEFSTVNCDIAAGHYPTAADFPQPTFVASGYNTNLNSTVDLSSMLSLTATAVIN
jgi:hypothetical protein